MTFSNPFAQAIEFTHTSSPEMLAILAGAVIGVLLFVVMVSVYFATLEQKPAAQGFAFAAAAPIPQQPMFIPPYPVGERQALSSPDPVAVFRTMPDLNQSAIETGPMSAITMPDADSSEGWTIVGLGTHSEELAEELALQAAWLPQARRHELATTDSSPVITVLGEEDFEGEDITAQILRTAATATTTTAASRRPKIRRIAAGFENHP